MKNPDSLRSSRSAQQLLATIAKQLPAKQQQLHSRSPSLRPSTALAAAVRPLAAGNSPSTSDCKKSKVPASPLAPAAGSCRPVTPHVTFPYKPGQIRPPKPRYATPQTHAVLYTVQAAPKTLGDAPAAAAGLKAAAAVSTVGKAAAGRGAVQPPQPSLPASSLSPERRCHASRGTTAITLSSTSYSTQLGRSPLPVRYSESARAAVPRPGSAAAQAILRSLAAASGVQKSRATTAAATAVAVGSSPCGLVDARRTTGTATLRDVQRPPCTAASVDSSDPARASDSSSSSSREGASATSQSGDVAACSRVAAGAVAAEHWQEAPTELLEQPHWEQQGDMQDEGQLCQQVIHRGSSAPVGCYTPANRLSTTVLSASVVSAAAEVEAATGSKQGLNHRVAGSAKVATIAGDSQRSVKQHQQAPAAAAVTLPIAMEHTLHASGQLQKHSRPATSASAALYRPDTAAVRAMLGTAYRRDGVEERLQQLQRMNEQHEGEELDLVYGEEGQQLMEEKGSTGADSTGEEWVGGCLICCRLLGCLCVLNHESHLDEQRA